MGKEYNLLAILSFIFAFVFFPAGLVLGIVALTQIKKTKEKGQGLAIASLVISGLALFVFIMILIVWISVIGIISSAFGSI
jgi:hypothetical protein